MRQIFLQKAPLKMSARVLNTLLFSTKGIYNNSLPQGLLLIIQNFFTPWNCNTSVVYHFHTYSYTVKVRTSTCIECTRVKLQKFSKGTLQRATYSKFQCCLKVLVGFLKLIWCYLVFTFVITFLNFWNIE